MPNEDSPKRRHAILGALLGTAVGDSIGLPYEGLSPNRAAKLFPPPVRQRFFLGRGMISDDTEHTCMVAESLLAAGGNTQEFGRQFARRLRHWFWCCPAGIGLATLRACLKLTFGVPPARSGVFSAGNGPAMRAAIIGAAVDDLTQLREIIAISTRITHTDPRAEHGALAIALAARHARDSQPLDPSSFIAELEQIISHETANDLIDLLRRAATSVANGEPASKFAADLGLVRGVTGYVNHTVPVALHAAWSHPGDFRAAIESILRCGGDADSNAAIVGGIVGTTVGKDGIPSDWLDRLRDWPRSVTYIEALADQLSQFTSSKQAKPPQGLPVYTILARNAFFAAVVIGHALRRLLPPFGLLRP
jgi:ADP-ribosyl-[dinitrogen reductase] hydrolase